MKSLASEPGLRCQRFGSVASSETFFGGGGGGTVLLLDTIWSPVTVESMCGCGKFPAVWKIQIKKQESSL